MKILNKTKNTLVAEHVVIADTVMSRLVGLLTRAALHPREALVITRCRCIHMFFMRFAIDVLFVDRRHVVVGCVERIKPFRASPYFFRASYAIELPQGAIAFSQTAAGDQLVLEPGKDF